MSTETTPGRCLCGGVRFAGLGAASRVEICHCATCRRHSAGPLMSVYFPGGVRFDADDTLRWYASSDIAERGFCERCGSVLFWRMHGADKPSVSAHAVEGTLGPIREHVFVDEKPDWYDFADDAPRTTAAEMHARLEAWKQTQVSPTAEPAEPVEVGAPEPRDP